MFLLLSVAMSKHVIKAYNRSRMSSSLLVPNMDSGLRLKESDFDVASKTFGMKLQKDAEIKLQTNLAG